MTINGLRLRYFNAGQGEQTLIFLHGWGQDSRVYLRTFAPLAAEYRVLMLDLPSFGNSAIAPHDWGFSEYGELVAEFMRQVGGASPEHPVLLGGHSFGGGVAISASGQMPGAVKELFLLSSAGVPVQRKKLWLVIGKPFSELLQLYYARAWRETWGVIASFLYHLFFRPLATWRVSLIPYHEDLRPLMSQIKTRVHLMWAERDIVIPVAMGEEMAEIFKVPLTVFSPNYFHEWMVVDPEVFLREFKRCIGE